MENEEGKGIGTASRMRRMAWSSSRSGRDCGRDTRQVLLSKMKKMRSERKWPVGEIRINKSRAFITGEDLKKCDRFYDRKNICYI